MYKSRNFLQDLQRNEGRLFDSVMVMVDDGGQPENLSFTTDPFNQFQLVFSKALTECTGRRVLSVLRSLDFSGVMFDKEVVLSHNGVKKPLRFKSMSREALVLEVCG